MWDFIIEPIARIAINLNRAVGNLPEQVAARKAAEQKREAAKVAEQEREAAKVAEQEYALAEEERRKEIVRFEAIMEAARIKGIKAIEAEKEAARLEAEKEAARLEAEKEAARLEAEKETEVEAEETEVKAEKEAEETEVETEKAEVKAEKETEVETEKAEVKAEKETEVEAEETEVEAEKEHGDDMLEVPKDPVDPKEVIAQAKLSGFPVYNPKTQPVPEQYLLKGKVNPDLCAGPFDNQYICGKTFGSIQNVGGEYLLPNCEFEKTDQLKCLDYSKCLPVADSSQIVCVPFGGSSSGLGLSAGILGVLGYAATPIAGLYAIYRAGKGISNAWNGKNVKPKVEQPKKAEVKEKKEAVEAAQVVALTDGIPSAIYLAVRDQKAQDETARMEAYKALYSTPKTAKRLESLSAEEVEVIAKLPAKNLQVAVNLNDDSKLVTLNGALSVLLARKKAKAKVG